MVKFLATSSLTEGGRLKREFLVWQFSKCRCGSYKSSNNLGLSFIANLMNTYRKISLITLSVLKQTTFYIALKYQFQGYCDNLVWLTWTIIRKILSTYIHQQYIIWMILHFVIQDYSRELKMQHPFKWILIKRISNRTGCMRDIKTIRFSSVVLN